MSLVGEILNPFGAMVDGAFNYASVKETNKANERINERQIEAARELQQYQNTFNEEMWNKNNLYNSPSNQRKLLEAAGFNPYMLYNGGSGSQQIQSAAGSVPSAIPMQAYQSTVGRDLAAAVNQSYDNHIKAEQAKQLSIQTDFAFTKQVLDIEEQKSRIKMSNLSADEKARQVGVLDDTLNYLKHTQKARINQTKEEANKVSAERATLDWNLYWSQFTSNLDYMVKEQNLHIARATVWRIEADVQKIYNDITNSNRITDKQVEMYTNQITSLIMQNEHNKEYYPIVREQTRAMIEKLRRRQAGVSAFGFGINGDYHPFWE